MIAWRPFVSCALGELDLVAVDREAVDDLAERERDDRDVVAAQAQRRQADDHPRDGAQIPPRRDEEEVQVDAGQVRGELAGQDVDAVAAVDRREVVGGKPADRVRAEGVEGDVAEVQQAGEADDDVQPQGHDDVGRGQDAVVRDVRQRVEEQRHKRRDAECDDGQREVLCPRPP